MVTLFTQLSSQSQSTGGSGKGGLQDTSRCSLTGVVKKIPPNAEDMDVIRMRYSLTHTYADQVMDSPKFSFYRLEPKTKQFFNTFQICTDCEQIYWEGSHYPSLREFIDSIQNQARSNIIEVKP